MGLSISGGGGGVDPTADATITGTWAFADDAPPAPATVDIPSRDTMTGEPIPGSVVRYTATTTGTAGNLITIGTHADGVPSQPLRVEITPPDEWTARTTLTIYKATDSTGAEISATAADIVSIINDTPVAAALVTASIPPGADGTTIYGAFDQQNLAGGTNTPQVRLRAGVATSPMRVQPDELEAVPLTLRCADGSTLGNAVLNIEYRDGEPTRGDSGYGVSHLDSDGGGAFASERITFSERGELHLNYEAALGDRPFVVKIDGGDAFSIGTPGVGFAMSVLPRSAEQVGWMFYPYTDATADVIVSYDPTDGATPRFRVTPMGEVHASGGVVLTSPDGTAYRLVVANDGTLSAVAV